MALLGACPSNSSSGSGSTDLPAAPSCFESLDALAQEPQRVAFKSVGVSELDMDGLTSLLDVTGPADGALALRVSDPAGKSAPVCVQLDTVQDPAAASWVTPPASQDDYGPFCQSCAQRVSVQVNSGMFVLPSNDHPPPAASMLKVRLASRDCTTFLPHHPDPLKTEQLRVEALTVPAVPDTRAGEILIEVAIAQGSPLYSDPAPLPDMLVAALASVNSQLAPGKLSVRAVRVRRVESDDPLKLTRGDAAPLQALFAKIHDCDTGGAPPDDRWVPLVLAGCLSVTDPLDKSTVEPDAYTPRIPDGLTAAGQAHGIYLKGKSCQGSGGQAAWSAELLAKLIAHELGHYLGLYHTVEEDGTTDQLDDTSAANIMYFRPVVETAQGYSASQLRVMRRHPAIRWL